VESTNISGNIFLPPVSELCFRIYKSMGLYRCWLCTTQCWNL